tara:strand:+ start:1665 stop:3920 length:2256 start_codon:yes stop_codon:yes gene_type:complete
MAGDVIDNRIEERLLISYNERRKNESIANIAAYFGLEDNKLYPYIISRGNAEQAEGENNITANSFIRWDALCHLFNLHFIPTNPKDQLPSFVLTCTQLINEDLPIIEKVTELGYEVKTGKHISPILMAKVNNPLASKISAGIETALDNSLDPTVCLAPHQVMGALRDPRSTQLQTMFAKHGIIPNTGDKKLGEELDKMCNYDLTPDEKKYYIGHMLLNVNKLQQTYKSMKYDDDGTIKKDFSLFDYIKKIWEDVSDAGGNNHDFKITTDFERPNIVRVVDMRYQESANLIQEDIIELNIQSNDSIVRDFAFNTSIPSAMSSTIAIAAQAPKNVDSLEAASFGAFHQNISNRFAQFIDPSEEEGLTEKEKKDLENDFDGKMKTYVSGLSDLEKHYNEILKGAFMIATEGGETTKSEQVGKMKGLVNAVKRASVDLVKMYPKTENGHFKGQPIPKAASSPTSAIIPLKFTATLDGMGGIVIGNVFKIPDSRLPRGYKDANIAFVVMTEDQKITSGQDWTTKITGQMIILPTKGKAGEVTKDGWEGMDYNQYNESADTTTQYNEDQEGHDITNEQKEIDENINSIKPGNKIYLKLATEHTHVRSSHVIDNESFLGFGDNIIGVFKPGNKGLYLGTVEVITDQPIYVIVPGTLGNEKTRKEGEKIIKTTRDIIWYADADGNPDRGRGEIDPESIPANASWPWYKINFSEEAQEKFNVGDLFEGSYDKNGADDGDHPMWVENKQGWMRLDTLMGSK